jgi:hypothetical protein
MDRSAEFRSLCETNNVSLASSASASPGFPLPFRSPTGTEAPQLRQRLQSPNADKDTEEPEEPGPLGAVRTFLEECLLVHRTVRQLNEELSRLAHKPSALSFTAAAPDRNPGAMASMEQALNICTANLALLGKRLRAIREDVAARETRRARGSGVLSWIVGGKSADPKDMPDAANLPSQSLLEHCRLVVESLEKTSGLLTETLEAHKQWQRKRAALLHHGPSFALDGGSGRDADINRTRDKGTGIRRRDVNAQSQGGADAHRDVNALGSSSARRDVDAHTASDTHRDAHVQSQQILLQTENTHLVEELLGSLASTESQVLEIARLQAALSAHLAAQFHLTARIFEESVEASEDTRKGNAHLRRAGNDSAFGRRAFVAVVCSLALVLLLLHYFRQ